ncbi:MAG: hypothetical protein PWP67_2915 [Clostridium butyricum]|uniref:LysM domain-containing protein n=1 Tax=Clostridium butyricum TaxID=1492 RepID=A0A512TSF8_CLOBU|nr:DUF6448 family protein [Clostridium butyricum]MDK2830081.1 hypothetical protein [Clostridium butyricum]NOW22741.1 hypothetical protein [Clostridium butyricum]GEQ23179.1 hypothetical protein CBU02nite_36850 [Clostridium butyricum]
MIKSKTMASLLVALTLVVALPTMASAHCDTMDGPTVADGKKAIESNNINYVLKWVTPENEKEISEIFDLSMKVKDLSPEAKKLSENYFFENLVRIHRAGEGVSFTGVKPSGTAIDEKVLAADKSIAVGNLSPLENLVEEDKMPELKERFEKVMALKDYNVNDVEAGRKYIEAYVSFFKFAEGEEESHNAEAGHGVEDSHGTEAASLEKSHDESENLSVIPWSLAGVFALTTLILGIAYHKKASK